MELEQPELPVHTAVQQVSKTEMMKVFDFDDNAIDDGHDSVPVGITTIPTGTGAARGASPPSGGQKLIRRVRVDHTGRRAGVSAKRSKVVGEACVSNNKRVSLSKASGRNDELDNCDASSSVPRGAGRSGNGGTVSRSYNMGVKSLSDPGTKGLLEPKTDAKSKGTFGSRPESRSVFESRNNTRSKSTVGSRTESKKTAGTRIEPKSTFGSRNNTESRSTLESSTVSTFGSGTESKSTSRIGESRSWASPLLNSVNEAPPTKPPTTPPSLPGTLNKRGQSASSTLSRHKSLPKPAKSAPSDDPYAFSLTTSSDSDSQPPKRPKPHAKVDSGSKSDSDSKVKAYPVVQVKADYSNLKRKRADSAILLSSKTSRVAPQALFQNAESASSSGEADMLQEIDSLLEGGSEEGRGLELCEGGASDSVRVCC